MTNSLQNAFTHLAVAMAELNISPDRVTVLVNFEDGQRIRAALRPHMTATEVVTQRKTSIHGIDIECVVREGHLGPATILQVAPL